MKPQIVPTKLRKIKLQNGLEGHKDYGKKFDLYLVHKVLHNNQVFKSSFDTDANPYQNFVQIEVQNLNGVTGSFWVYSNGTMNTNIGLSNALLISLSDFLYQMYLQDCLKEVK